MHALHVKGHNDGEGTTFPRRHHLRVNLYRVTCLFEPVGNPIVPWEA